MFQRKETSDKFSSVYIIACLFVFKEAGKLTVYLLYVENQKNNKHIRVLHFYNRDKHSTHQEHLRIPAAIKTDYHPYNLLENTQT